VFGALDISASGLIANRTRLQVATTNIANMNSVVGPDGEYAPFRRRMALLAEGDPASGRKEGVHVSQIMESDGPFRKKYEPGHPFADEDGYVNYPDIDPSMEQINALEATRAYEANIMAAEATKSMLSLALRVLA
jgi:flagellar basal-body rod protein FlgC